MCSSGGRLPTAQNVFLFASPYGRGMSVARDVIVCTTVLSIGALLLVAWLVHQIPRCAWVPFGFPLTAG